MNITYNAILQWNCRAFEHLPPNKIRYNYDSIDKHYSELLYKLDKHKTQFAFSQNVL